PPELGAPVADPSARSRPPPVADVDKSGGTGHLARLAEPQERWCRAHRIAGHMAWFVAGRWSRGRSSGRCPPRWVTWEGTGRWLLGVHVQALLTDEGGRAVGVLPPGPRAVIPWRHVAVGRPDHLERRGGGAARRRSGGPARQSRARPH